MVTASVPVRSFVGLPRISGLDRESVSRDGCVGNDRKE